VLPRLSRLLCALLQVSLSFPRSVFTLARTLALSRLPLAASFLHTRSTTRTRLATKYVILLSLFVFTQQFTFVVLLQSIQVSTLKSLDTNSIARIVQNTG